MAYNKAKEEYRWNQWKAEEEKILREQGVEEEMIQKLREMTGRISRQSGDSGNTRPRFWTVWNCSWKKKKRKSPSRRAWKPCWIPWRMKNCFRSVIN